MNIAVIPARGGSKRIPKKNIKEFCGKPMISYSIDVAKSTGLFQDIIVSTDSEEITQVSKKYGANVPFTRPAELSDDFTTTGSVMAHAVNWIQENMGELSAVCCIYSTAPFIQRDDLIKGYNKLLTNKWEFVFSATSFVYPIQRAFMKLKKDGIKMFNPEHFETRSQDLPEAYHDAGQFYWGKPDTWLNEEAIFSESSTFHEIPNYRVVDIDTENDWKRAEILFKTIKQSV